MKTTRVAKMDADSETQTPRRARQNRLWWALFFMWVACPLVATGNGWALGKSSLNGTYVLYDLQSAFGGGPDRNGGWGVSDSSSISRVEVTFNGTGGWSGTSTNYELERQISEVQQDLGGDQVLSNKFKVLAPDPSTDSISGTYTVSSDGSGSITHPEGTDPIFVRADGNLFLMGKRNYDAASRYAYVNLAVAVKKGSGQSAASLNGTYVLYDLQSAFGGGPDRNGGWGVSDSSSISRAEVTFNGAGSWSGTSTLYELERQISEVQYAISGQDQVLSNKFTLLAPDPSTDSISGTYSIDSDGSGSVTHPEGTDPIFVSADGNLFLMGKRNYDAASRYAYVNLAVGVKKGSRQSAASLNGPYVIYDLQSAFGGGPDRNGGWGVSDSSSISRAEVTFNGAGGWSGTSTDYELERQISEVQFAISGQDQVLSDKFTVLAPNPSTDSISGTYTVSSDGSGSITHPEGTDPIFVSADGSVILMGKRNYDAASRYAYVNLTVGVKKTSARPGMPWIQLLLTD
jgi:hypothetical protein